MWQPSETYVDPQSGLNFLPPPLFSHFSLSCPSLSFCPLPFAPFLPSPSSCPPHFFVIPFLFLFSFLLMLCLLFESERRLWRVVGFFFPIYFFSMQICRGVVRGLFRWCWLLSMLTAGTEAEVVCSWSEIVCRLCISSWITFLWASVTVMQNSRVLMLLWISSKCYCFL